MTEFLRPNLEIYFIENHFAAEKIAEQAVSYTHLDVYKRQELKR